MLGCAGMVAVSCLNGVPSQSLVGLSQRFALPPCAGGERLLPLLQLYSAGEDMVSSRGANCAAISLVAHEQLIQGTSCAAARHHQAVCRWQCRAFSAGLGSAGQRRER